MKLLHLALLALWIACQAPASESGTPLALPSPQGGEGGVRGAQTPASGWERYQVLLQRNIFAKDRGRRARSLEQDKEEMGPPAPKAEAENILIGIVEKDGRLLAFMENSRTGAVQIVRTDDPIARGKVAAISLDNIEYVCGDLSLIVSIGKNLEGGTSTASGEPAKLPATGPSSAPVSPETNALLELMRKRRQEAMNR